MFTYLPSLTHAQPLFDSKSVPSSTTYKLEPITFFLTIYLLTLSLSHWRFALTFCNSLDAYTSETLVTDWKLYKQLITEGFDSLLGFQENSINS